MVVTNALNPRILQPGDIDPNWRWDKHIPSLGIPQLILNVVLIMIVYVVTAYREQRML